MKAFKLDESLQVGESLKDENAKLKARIAALEAIVTEPSYELKEHIQRITKPFLRLAAAVSAAMRCVSQNCRHDFSHELVIMSW